ncbi:MAG: hypothetical protein AAFR87_32510 [Bacteroidota bacterium]
MISRKKYLAVLAFLMLNLSAFACPCEEGKGPEDFIEGANQIFVGKVIGVNTNWISGGMKYTFVVEKTWKRGADSLLVVNTGWDYECGSQFEDGKKYLVYGLKKFSLRTSECMGSKALEAAGPDLELLGEGNAPRKSAMVPIAGWGMGVMVLLAFLFLTFVIFKNKIRRSS